MNAPMNLGLIGAGRWGRVYISALENIDGIRLSRLCSANPDSAALVPADCVITPDWHAVAQATDLDGVIIATPPHLHCEMTMAALDAGNPVLVEKPLTLDVVEAEALLAAATAKGAIVHVNHIHLYHPAYGALKRLGPEMGAVCAIHGIAGNKGPLRADTPVLWDWGPHDVAMCLDLMGGVPQTVSARRVKTQGAAGENIAIRLTFDGGVTADIDISNILDDKKRLLSVQFDRGMLTYDEVGPDTLTRQATPGDITVIDVDTTPPLNCAIHAFAEAIRTGGPSLDGLKLAVEVVRVLAACESLYLDG